MIKNKITASGDSKQKELDKSNFYAFLDCSVGEKYKNEKLKEARIRLKYELNLINDEQILFFCLIANTIKKLGFSSNLLFPELRSANSLLLYLINASCIDPLEYKLNPDLFYKMLEKDNSLHIVIATPLKENIILISGTNKLIMKADSDVLLLSNLFLEKYLSFKSLRRISGSLIKHLCGKNQWCFDPDFVNDNALGIKSFSNMFYIKGAIKKPTFIQLVSTLPINYDGGVIDNVAYAMVSLKDDYKNLPLTQDSLYELLLKYKVPSKMAFDICKPSKLKCRLSKERKQELRNYCLDSDLINYINNINYLIPLGHVISKAIIGLYMYFYKINYPYSYYKNLLTTCYDDSIKIDDDHKEILRNNSSKSNVLARLLLLEAQYRGLNVKHLCKWSLSNKL